MHNCPKCNREVQGRPNFCPACGVSITYSRRNGADPLVGQIIDATYEVVEIVGEGSMGRVYRAQHIQLRKQVALKVLHANLVSDTTVVKRFEREAQAASRLNHPNCISMFGYGREENSDLLWMAMEFIEGRDLGSIIAEDSPLPAKRVLHIMSQVCDALDEAHSANVIHRDLKPANIVCFDHRRTRDFVKVLDFGIAKIVGSEQEYQPLTREGIVCGTPAYMSPEQVQGLELDPRSDLFSLGIILYQTLTGSLPFLGDSAVEVATKIVVDQPIAPSEARFDWSYPPELEEIVLKLLSKNRDDRYRGAHEVKRALEDCLYELHDRRDASLDLRPDELAEILAGVDALPEGTDTIRISDELVAQALAPIKQDVADEPLVTRETIEDVEQPEAVSVPPPDTTPDIPQGFEQFLRENQGGAMDDAAPEVEPSVVPPDVEPKREEAPSVEVVHEHKSRVALLVALSLGLVGALVLILKLF